jgi:hypothetical protein
MGACWHSAGWNGVAAGVVPTDRCGQRFIAYASSTIIIRRNLESTKTASIYCLLNELRATPY